MDGGESDICLVLRRGGRDWRGKGVMPYVERDGQKNINVGHQMIGPKLNIFDQVLAHAVGRYDINWAQGLSEGTVRTHETWLLG